MSYDELNLKIVKPKKTRRCEWCWFTPIEAGRECINRVYVYEGDFHNEYMHLECYAAANWLWNKYPDDCEFTPGDCGFGEVAPGEELDKEERYKIISRIRKQIADNKERVKQYKLALKFAQRDL